MLCGSNISCIGQQIQKAFWRSDIWAKWGVFGPVSNYSWEGWEHDSLVTLIPGSTSPGHLCGWQNNDPWRCPLPNLQNLWICYFPWQREIEIANQLILKWREYAGLSRWALCSYQSPYKSKTEESQHQRDAAWERLLPPATASFADRKWGHEPREADSLKEIEKQRHRVLLRAFRRNTILLTPFNFHPDPFQTWHSEIQKR